MGNYQGIIRIENGEVSPQPSPPSIEKVIDAIRDLGDQLQVDGVLGVRPGFSNKERTDTPDPVILVVTQPGASPTGLPAQLNGIAIELRTASAQEQLQGILPLSAWENAVAEAGPPAINYEPPPADRVALEEMSVSNITCHIGPDSGWTTLKSFLDGTTTSLTVAMYEFYAQHIIDAVTALGSETDATLNMILQVDKNDLTIEETLREHWGDRLQLVPALVRGPNRIFNNSYHTKVAVRDSSAFWLSSGNWSPNSQPVLKPGTENFTYKNGNREWHVIIEDEPLAQMYEKFILYDMEKAREGALPEAAPLMPDLLIPESMLEAEADVIQPHPFLPKTFAATGKPVKVMPLMSPDNYAATILQLIQGAEQSLYLQFSYINQPSAAIFNDIISAITQKMKDGLDVRILVSNNQKAESADLLIATRHWKRSMFRMQKNKMHNKGVLVDGKIAVVGSNNWSSDGTQYNRDTSLVFYSRPITKYYTEVFLFDWDNLSRPIARAQEIQPVLAPETGPTPLGMVRVPWQSWYTE
ncbi:phospholipase [Chitinophaga agrisoli]|uniref:phospholipase D n=1 Tax=Chitinophaga agrisoli TaxID=2607653 RepID=A0A5B2VKP6_9BACT|nr:phospholipase D-like domain-containing protein [Chitinophaga agrisoli]KAA2238779.1 phospholipase [Chitinophaga agrisoli]